MKPSDAASARRDRELSDLKRRVDEGLRVLRRQQRRRLDAPTLADVDEDEDRIKRVIEGTLLLEEVLKRSVPPPDDEGDLVLFRFAALAGAPILVAHPDGARYPVVDQAASEMNTFYRAREAPSVLASVPIGADGSDSSLKARLFAKQRRARAY